VKNYKSKFKIDAVTRFTGFRFQVPKAPKKIKPVKPGRAQEYTMFLAGIFLLLLVVVGLSEVNRGQSLKKQILGDATTGYDFLTTARQGLLDQDLKRAQQNFVLASQSFVEARSQINEAGGVVGQLVKILPQGRDLDRILLASAHVSRALELSTSGLQEFTNSKLSWDSATNSSGIEFFKSVRLSHESFVKASHELESALELLSQVNPASLPNEFRQQYVNSLSQLSLASQVLTNVVRLQDIILQLLGGEPKTYLLMFQNNNEIRASGGFIGTYGILRFENGSMKIDRIESIYHLEGQLQDNIVPPIPIARLLNDRWGIHDSNWFVDFPMSARKFIEFYELTTGELADGVISMTPDVFEELLAITGPIPMEEYGETLTHENFRERVQFKTSTDYDRVENRPKKLLSDFAPKLLQQFSSLPPEKFLDGFDTLLQMVSQKQILMFSLNESVQQNLTEFGATGEIVDTTGDYLAIFHSNVGGGKTDLGLNTKVQKEVVIDEFGKVTVSLTITRSHQAFNEQYFPRNVDFMRILVPLGSKLISASGFEELELDEFRKSGYVVDPDVDFWQSQQVPFQSSSVNVGTEAGYTEFSGWLELDPGQSKTVTLSYKLPFQVENIYTQTLQKQPGIREFDFTLSVIHSSELLYAYPERYESVGREITFSEVVSSDRFHALVIK